MKRCKHCGRTRTEAVAGLKKLGIEMVISVYCPQSPTLECEWEEVPEKKSEESK